MTNHRPKPLLAHSVELTVEDMDVLRAACRLLDKLFDCVEEAENQTRINTINISIENLIEDMENCANNFAVEDEDVEGMIIEFMQTEESFTTLDGRKFEGNVIFKQEDK